MIQPAGPLGPPVGSQGAAGQDQEEEEEEQDDDGMQVVALATDMSFEGAALGHAAAALAQNLAAIQMEGATGQPCPVATYVTEDDAGYYSPVQSGSPAGSADLEAARSRTPRAGQGRPPARVDGQGGSGEVDGLRLRAPRQSSHRGFRAID